MLWHSAKDYLHHVKIRYRFGEIVILKKREFARVFQESLCSEILALNILSIRKQLIIFSRRKKFEFARIFNRRYREVKILRFVTFLY